MKTKLVDALIALFIFLPGMGLLNAFVFKQLWNWFVAGIVHHEVTMVEGIGLTTVLYFLLQPFHRYVAEHYSEKEYTTGQYTIRCISSIIGILVLWGTGALCFHYK